MGQPAADLNHRSFIYPDGCHFHWESSFQMRLLYISLFLAISPPASLAISLGPAGQFDLFVLGDMEARHSDVEGKMAVGGNANLEDYAVGLELDETANFSDTLIVGGDLNFVRGRVYHGNIVTGGHATTQNVGLYHEDPASPNGVSRSGNPLDFHAIAEDLRNRSNRWASFSSNGSVNTVGDDSSWRLFLEGSDPRFNVFNLDSDQLEGADTFYLDVPLQSTVLINVDGILAEMAGFGFYRKIDQQWFRIPDNRPNDDPALAFRQDGSLTRKVLFNFFNATALDIHSIGVKGSILAPWADVDFYNGHVDGNLIVQSLRSPQGEQTGQVNHYIFIPEPTTTWLVLVAMLVLFHCRMPNRYPGRSLLKTAGRGWNSHRKDRPPPNSS